MGKMMVGVLLAFVFVLVGLLAVGGTCVSYYNRDADLHNKSSAQAKLVQGVHSKMVTTVSQQAQVVKASKEFQIEAANALIKGRQGTFMKLIHEHNPQFSIEQYTQLMNSIAGLREEFFMVQADWQSIVEQHRNLYDHALSGMVLSVVGKGRPDLPPMITNDVTEDVIKKGKESEAQLELNL